MLQQVTKVTMHGRKGIVTWEIKRINFNFFFFGGGSQLMCGLLARTAFVTDTEFVSETGKKSLIFFSEEFCVKRKHVVLLECPSSPRKK